MIIKLATNQVLFVTEDSIIVIKIEDFAKIYNPTDKSISIPGEIIDYRIPLLSIQKVECNKLTESIKIYYKTDANYSVTVSPEPSTKSETTSTLCNKLIDKLNDSCKCLKSEKLPMKKVDLLLHVLGENFRILALAAFSIFIIFWGYDFSHAYVNKIGRVKAFAYFFSSIFNAIGEDGCFYVGIIGIAACLWVIESRVSKTLKYHKRFYYK